MKTKKGKKGLLIAGIVVASLLATMSLGLAIVWKQPLAPRLSTPVPHQPSPDSSSGVQSATATNEATGEGAAISLPTEQSEPLCNGPQVMTILAIGSDYRGAGGDYLYGLADVIRVVRVDFTQPAITMINIPRDLWVKIPGLEHKNIDHGKINQAYFFGTPGMGYYDGSAGGAGLLAETLYENFDVFPDHYMVVSMTAFVRLVDEVGGIDVTLTQAVDGNINSPAGENDNLGYYDIGTHHFNGETALKFSRIRYGYPELQRIENQTILLKALYSKMLSKEILPNLIDIFTAFQGKSILTDLSIADVTNLICVAQSINFDKIRSGTLPADTFTADIIFSPIQNAETFVYMPDIEKEKAIFKQFMEGTWP